MKPQKIAVVQEDDDSSLDKPSTKAKGTEGGKVDYAKILQEFADMKEELEKIPTKYDKNNKSKNDSEENESQENLEVNLVKTMDAPDPNDETENLAYTEPSKQEPSEENEAYEEDFEKSNEVNEDVEQNEENEEDKGNKSKTVDDEAEDKVNKSKTVDDAEGDKSSVKEPSKAEESEEKYGEEEFENDEDQNERKSDKKEQKAPQPVVAKGKPVPSKDVKKPPVSNSKTQSKEPPKPANQPKLAQTVPNKNFKVRTVASANTTATAKETKKEPVTLPPKDPKKPTMSSTTRPAIGVKPPLKRPSTATVPGPRSTSKPKEETGASKIEEDLEIPEEEENIAPNESAKPVAEKKLPPVSQRKSLKKKEESAPAQFEVEDTMVATESQAEVEPVKKRPASALPKSGLSKTQSKAATSSVKESQNEEEGDGDGEGEEGAGKTQGNSVRIRKVKKLEPKDMMKQIFEEYKKKENQAKQKDEKIFVIEETDKKIKGAGAGDQKQAGDQENNWIGTGVGVSTAVFDTQKKKKANEPKTTAKKDTGDQSAQGFAQKFLASLGAKIGKTSGPSDKAKENANEGTTKEKSEKPPKGKEKEAAKKDQGDGKEKNWKYGVGEGVDSEYAKKQKEKEQEYKKKFTELFSKEKAKQLAQKKENVQKLKEVMQRERENQKAQQETLVKNLRGKNQEAEKKEDRDSKVLQVQNIYMEESERHKREQQKDEINQLKLKLKLLKQQNEGLQKDLADMKHKDSDASKLLDSLASKKAVILLGKTDFTPLGLHTQPKRNNDMISPEKASQSASKQRILSDEDYGDKISTVEKIVNKFADQGFTLEQVYHLLDQNGDNLLTVKEIKEGLEKLELELQQSEIQELISILDRNSDGTITAEEFVAMLQDSMKARREYKNIMGDLDQILNPIVLEERMLDISIRRKIIEEDMKKEADQVKLQEHEYKKVLRRLQEYEGIAGPQEEKKVDLDVYRDNILKLKIEIQDAEDIKSRTVLMQGERMKDINENILALEDQIEKTIRRIHNEKSKMKDLAQAQQKEKIKDIFMKKAFGELEREINKFDYGIDQHVQQILEEKQRVQVRIEEDENQNAIGDQMMNGAAIKLQKVYRGSISRKKNKQDMFALLRAKSIILKKYRSFKNRTKAKTVLDSLQQIRNRRVRYGWVALKANLREKREEETKEKQRFAEERKRQRIEEAERARKQDEEEQERQRRMQEAQSYSRENLEESKENLDASVVSQASEIEGKKVPLYTVLYLQDIARKTHGLEGKKGVLYSTKGEIKSCKICNKNPVERVCKECEVAVFCAKCFDVTHRSRKNHQFIEVESQSKENDLLGKILRDDEQTFEEINMIKAKYKKDFVGLSQHFKDWDVDNKKSFEAEKLREVLQRKVKEKEDLDFLVDIGKYYCSVSQYDSKIDYVLFAQLLEA